MATVLVGPSFIDWNQYRDEFAAYGKAFTGRDFIIGGDISITLLPSPALLARDVRLANLAGASAPEMVRLKSLEVRIAPGPLIGFNIQVETVRLIEPVIELEVLPDGRRNWTFAKPEGGEEAPAPATGGEVSETSMPAVRLDNFVIVNGMLNYRDGRTGTVERITGLDARIEAASLIGPFESSGRLVVRGVPLSYEAAVGKIIHERTVPFGLSLGTKAGETTVRMDGTLVSLTDAPKFKGKVTAAGKDLAGLVRMRQSAGPLPGFLGQPFTVEGDVVASAAGAEVKELSITLGETTASGSAAMDLKEGVAVSTELSVGHVNLDKWLAMPPAAALPPKPPPPQTKGGQDGGQSKASIPLKPSPKATTVAAPGFSIPTDVNGSLVASVDAITVLGGLVRQLRANIELAEGEVTISQLSAQLPGISEVAAFGLVTTTDGQPHFDGKVEASVSDLRRVLGWLGLKAPRVPSDRLRKLALSGELRANPDEVQIADLDLRLDSSTVRGGITVAIRKRLAFGADLTLDRLNLDSYLTSTTSAAPGKAGAAASDAARTAGEPQSGPAAAPDTNPLAVLALLNDFDANVKARLGTVIYRRTPIKNIALEGTLHNGSLEVRQASVGDLAGASAKASGTIAGLSGVPELKGVRFNLRAANLTRLFRLAGVEPPVAPDKLGAVNVNARIDGSMLKPMVDLGVKAAGGSVSVAGTLAVLRGGIEMKLEASHPDLTALLGKLDVEYRPAGPIGGVEISAAVKADAASVTLTDVKGKVGSVSVAGDASVALGGPRPKISADLTTGEIVVDRFLPEGRTAWLGDPRRAPHVWRLIPAAWPELASSDRSRVRLAATAAAGAGRWPKDPIDLKALQSFDAKLDLKATALTFDNYRLDDAEIKATLTSGVLRAERLTGNLFGGSLGASALVKSAPAPSIDITATLRNADLRQALRAAAGKAAASGRMELDVKVSATGRSVADMVASLGGSGSFALSGLDIQGGARGTALAPVVSVLGLVNQLGGVLGGRKGSGLADTTGSFRIDRGVVRSENLKLVSNLSNGQAKGSIDLVNWQVDLAGELKMSRNVLTSLLAKRVKIPEVVPFEVKGRLDAPKISYSTGGAKGGAGGTGIKALDRLLKKKGIGGLLDRILPGRSEVPAPPQQSGPQPSGDGTLAPPPPPPEKRKTRPEDLLKQLFKIR